MEVISTIDNGCIIEEVDTFIFSMPKDYALGHCVAKDMRMSAGIATKFKLLNNLYNYEMLRLIIFHLLNILNMISG